MHAPEPLHTVAPTAVLPEQVPGPQLFSAPGYEQLVALEPLQKAPHVPDPAQGDRPMAGGPFEIVVQVPVLFARLHASHWPVHVLSQQTPSTQNPELHGSGELHGVPIATLSWQMPAAQNCPAGQGVVAQSPSQIVAPHTNGAQTWVCGAGQAPVPEHLAS